MESIDQLLNKWKEAHDSCIALEKTKQRYRDKIEKILNTHKTQNYENGSFKVVKRVQNRSSISKKDVPPDIWDKYATINRVSFITISSKKKDVI